MNALGYGTAVLDRALTGFKGPVTGIGFGTAAAAYAAIRGRGSNCWWCWQSFSWKFNTWCLAV